MTKYKKIWNRDLYTTAWNFASRVHQGQLVPGTDIAYINHIGNVAMECLAVIGATEVEDPDLLIQCALLHDVIEDTDTGYEQVAAEFGAEVADGVAALSKNKNLDDKTAQMTDSLQRIRQQPQEVWMVKLADRISNLQPPPAHWDSAKMKRYRDEATAILQALGSASDFLAARLAQKIADYAIFFTSEYQGDGKKKNGEKQ